MDKDYTLLILETLDEVLEITRRLKENPLLVTAEDLDRMEYNIDMLNNYSKNFLDGK